MQKEHEQVMELLPWYVNDTLSGKEAETVLKHLVECRECQSERDRLYSLQTTIQETDVPSPGYELSLRRVMKRIETSERNKDSMLDVELFQRKSRWLPLGLAASVFSILVAGAAWLNIEFQQVPTEDFQTLSSDAPSFGQGQRMELGFVSPIPATTMRQALIETQSNIVSGPDEHGNYLVEVVVPGTMTPGEFLARIRQIEGVEYAQFAEN